MDVLIKIVVIVFAIACVIWFLQGFFQGIFS